MVALVDGLDPNNEAQLLALGQEAGGTRACCALAVKASNEINTAIRKTVIARSSFKSVKMARSNLCEVGSLVLDNRRCNKITSPKSWSNSNFLHAQSHRTFRTFFKY